MIYLMYYTMFEGVCEFCAKKILNIFRCSRYFLVECYGRILWCRCSSI